MMTATKIATPDFAAYTFTDTPWDTGADKAKAADALCRFIARDFRPTMFTERVYRALSLHLFGHCAEFGREGFYGAWFSTPQRRAEWVRYACRGGMFGFHSLDRPDLWGDVERAVVDWLEDSGIGREIIAAGAAATEAAERAVLAELKAKYES